MKTHSAVAQAVAEGRADAGLGLQAAARSFGLDFIFLTDERYDLVIPETSMRSDAIQALLSWLQSPAARQVIGDLGGYDARETGSLTWV